MNRLILELLYEWEAQVPTAVAAVQNWGVPMRAPELNEMEWRRSYINQAAEVIPQWAEANAPNSYGGFYVDEREGGNVYVGFTENQQALVASLRGSGGLLDPEKLREFPNPPTRAIGSMEGLEEAVVGALATNASAEQATTGIELSDDGQIVRVGATNPSLVEQVIRGQLGSNAPIQVVADAPTISMASRYTISGPVVAGEALRVPNQQCTAGFSSRAPDHLVNGQMTYLYFVLTAGHCALKGDPVSREAIAELLPGPVIGVVRRYGFAPSSSFSQPSTDAAGVTIDRSLRSHSVLNGDPLEEQPILGTEPPIVGRAICWSGITSGRHCGKILKRVRRIVDGRYTKLFKVEGPDAEGDSGAPVWDPVTHKAVGLITSGEPASNMPCHTLPKNRAEWCPRMLFTPLFPRPNKSGDPPGIAPTLGIEVLREN